MLIWDLSAHWECSLDHLLGSMGDRGDVQTEFQNHCCFPKHILRVLLKILPFGIAHLLENQEFL